MPPITLTVNGARREADVEPRTLLADFLREGLGLTGTKVGCETSQCGSCTVHLDGDAVKSCTVLAVQADGGTVVTIEGLGDGLRAAPDAGGVLGAARPPVRVLHAGDDHVRRRSRGERRDHRRRDPARARRQPLPLHRLREHRQGGAAGGALMTTQVRGDDAPGRPGDQAGRGPAPHHRRREVPRRPQAAGRRARRDPPLAVRARPHRRDRRVARRGGAGRRRRLHGQGLRAPEPAAVRMAGGRRREPRGHAAGARDRQGHLHRRGRRGDRGRHEGGGRGRARPDRGRLGAARRGRRRRGRRRRRRAAAARVGAGQRRHGLELRRARRDRRRRSRRPTSSCGSGS